MPKIQFIAEYSDVARETEALVKEKGSTRPFYADYHVAMRLGHDGHDHPGSRLSGQVRRALNTLVERGVLIKIKRGDMAPWGYTATEPFFYTPEAYEREVEAGKQKQAEQNDRRVRQAAVDATFKAMGIPDWKTLEGGEEILRRLQAV